MKKLLGAIACIILTIIWIFLPDDEETKRRIELLEIGVEG